MTWQEKANWFLQNGFPVCIVACGGGIEADNKWEASLDGEGGRIGTTIAKAISALYDCYKEEESRKRLVPSLKKCPFCGSKYVELNYIDSAYAFRRYFAQCASCGVISANYGSTWEAAENWNRRERETE